MKKKRRLREKPKLRRGRANVYCIPSTHEKTSSSFVECSVAGHLVTFRMGGGVESVRTSQKKATATAVILCQKNAWSDAPGLSSFFAEVSGEFSESIGHQHCQFEYQLGSHLGRQAVSSSSNANKVGCPESCFSETSTQGTGFADVRSGAALGSSQILAL